MEGGARTRRPHREWLDDNHRMGQGVTPGAEPSSDGQKELEELGEDGIGQGRPSLHPPKIMMHFPPFSDFPLFSKKFLTLWKIFNILPFPTNFSIFILQNF